MHKKNDWLVSFQICRGSMRKWANEPRIYCILFLICLFEWVMIEPVKQDCVSWGLSISCWYFPFLFTNIINMLFFFFGILLLFCDAPFVDEQQMQIILRVGRKTWFRGKILYVFLSSCMYFFFMYVVSIIEFIPYVGFSLEWEDVIHKLTLGGQYSNMDRSIVATYTPIEATLLTYVICVLSAFFLGLLIFYLNLYPIHNLGLGVALTVILMTGILSRLPIMYQQAFLHILPLKWTDISIFTKDYGGVSPIYAITVLCILCTILILFIMHKSKSYSIEMMEDY